MPKFFNETVMKNIRIYRKNEYINNLVDVQVYVNNEKYTLSTDSILDVRSKNQEIEVYAKYLWVRSKKIRLNDTDKSYKIGIKPYMADKWMFIQVAFIILLYVLYKMTGIPFFEFLIKIVGISFMAVLFYFVSFGKNRYFKLSVENQLN